MRILSMTATFGKLNHQTIQFDPKLQVIEAPNEWGKSTWCAFITAMLYGIDSSKRASTANLADKQRYAPWSGAPMAGRMDIDWNGRAITIERQSKGRGFLNQFQAYNTATGAEITELTADNCGQVLFGVEKDVFLRSAFIKQSDLPVSDNQALRARLNALVTTGDDSGAAEALAEKLNALKNKCRHNKTGLLPEAERQREELRLKLRQLRELQSQQVHLQEQLEALEKQEKQLKNHKAALSFAESLSYTQKLADAQSARDLAQAKLQALQADCAAIATEAELNEKLATVRQLRANREDLQMRAQLLPAAPQMPAVTGGDVQQSEKDFAAYTALNKKGAPLSYIFASLLFVAGAALLLLPMPYLLTAALPAAAGTVLLIAAIFKSRKKAAALQALLAKHPGIPPENWIQVAQAADDANQQYAQALQAYQQQTQVFQQQLQALQAQTDALTGGMSLNEFEHQLLNHKQKRVDLFDAQKEFDRAESYLSVLAGSRPAVQPPTEPDTLTYTAEETARLLTNATADRSQLQQRLGQCQGQMAALGQEEQFSNQFDQVCDRITRLEQVYSAVSLAQEYLSKATQELQERFAPRISQRARDIMSRLTDGRYDRLYLKSDFSLNAGAQAEDSLRTPQWRSDGTIDQLYFALRLAVAEELSPASPLILDDAFVRFDDDRLQKALALLKEESAERQVLIFTCQSRENNILS